MAKLMEGKAGIVTGAGSGIGRASALAFAKEGAKVMVSDIRQEAGEETVRLIREAGGEAVFFQCDVSREEEVSDLVQAALKQFRRLDWAHNNAGISSPSVYLKDTKTSEHWDHILRINLDGVYYALKYEIEAMLQSGGGAIVNTASQAGLTGVQRKVGYVASKWGVNGITKTAALEYARHGIRVNSICPGMTKTHHYEIFHTQAPEYATFVENAIPMGRAAEPEEQANVAVWLCSEQASYITGVNLAVDGGLDAQSF